MDVYHALTEQGLDAAKRKLSHIVGRDVEPLDREGVLRASIETVAENLVDGVISPLFWAGVGGAPLAMASTTGPLTAPCADSRAGSPPSRPEYTLVA